MIAAKQMHPIRQPIANSVREAIRGLALDDTLRDEVGEVAVKGNLSQADNDAKACELAKLSSEVRGAVANLLRSGLVAWRRTADDGGDPRIAKAEAVIARYALGLTGEASLVKDRIHEVTGAVASEGTTGAVGSVGSRGEAEDEYASTRVSEAGDRAGPVGLVLIGAALRLADALAVRAETRTALAGDDGLMNPEKSCWERFGGRACHCIP